MKIGLIGADTTLKASIVSELTSYLKLYPVEDILEYTKQRSKAAPMAVLKKALIYQMEQLSVRDNFIVGATGYDYLVNYYLSLQEPVNSKLIDAIRAELELYDLLFLLPNFKPENTLLHSILIGLTIIYPLEKPLCLDLYDCKTLEECCADIHIHLYSEFGGIIPPRQLPI